MNKISLYFLLLFSISAIGQTTYNITDPEALEDQVYVAGDEIILANGTYSTDARINFIGNGTADNPITFRAETPGEVIFNGGLQMNIGGDYVVVDGFHWQGGYGANNFIQFRNGTDYANYSTIQNCAIDGLALSPDDIADGEPDPMDPDDPGSIAKHRWIVLYGTYNTVINCSFMNKASAGALILAEYQYNAEDDRCATVGHTISNNYFYKYEKIDNTLSNSGDSETIRIGTSEYQNVNSDVTVSNNYFVEADGENEIITNKSKGNTYINNTFRKCRGSLVLRHGSDATVDGNYFLGHNVDGTGGIRITDSNHTITNNYIQDCITVEDQAKWNNGITFIGGGASSVADCNSSSTSNGYQKSENILLSRNTIINTNAPLFYNIDKGSTDVTGTVSDNLIFFAADYPALDLTRVISGDTVDSYDDIGTALTYTGNVYKGTTLGETNAGFSEETGIIATADGEIFAFSGTGSTDKGANMGAYTPTTDAMVGGGIGACFLDYKGDPISSPTCTILIPESLTVSSLPTLAPDAGSYDVSVNANVNWTAISNDAWISIDTPSGIGNATVSVTVTENTVTTERVGTVTFTQDPGGDDIERILTVTQEGADPRTGLNLINVLADDVEAVYACHEEIPPNHTKENYKGDSLDKDTDTRWAGSAALGECVDYVSIIYDLKGAFDLDLIDIATTGGKTYNLQVWVSSTVPVSPATYPDDGDFTLAYPSSGFETISTNPDTFVPFILPTTALDTRYVKIVGDGQPSGSRYTTIHEIEFYGSQSLSVNDNEFNNDVVLYPVPVKDILHIKNLNSLISSVRVYSLDGRKIIEKTINSSSTELDMSLISNGTYIINFSNGREVSSSKKLIILH